MDFFHFSVLFAVILLSAYVGGQAAKAVKIPPVLGELCVGLILGPSFLGVIHDNESIWHLLAELGVVLLLFEVGLETQFSTLRALGKKPYFVATVGFMMPFVGAFLAAFYLFHLRMMVSAFIAGTLTATSIGLSVRVLKDLGQRHTHEAQIVVAAAVLDDLLGVLLLAILFDLATAQTLSIGSFSKTFMGLLGFMVIVPWLAHRLFARIKPPALPVSMGGLMLLAGLASLMGAPAIMGGFVAGLAASGHPPLRERLETQMQPLFKLFIPLFFVMVGVSLNLRQIPWNSPFLPLLTLCLLVIAIVGKWVSGYVIREPRKLQRIIGVSMIPRGEVGLIFAKLGLTSGVFIETQYAAVIIVVTLTSVLPPFILRRLYRS